MLLRQKTRECSSRSLYIASSHIQKSVWREETLVTVSPCGFPLNGIFSRNVNFSTVYLFCIFFYMKRKYLILVAVLFAVPALAEESIPQEHFVIDVGGGFATYSSLIVLGGAMEGFDYCNNGKCDTPDEVDYESNYAVASRAIFWTTTWYTLLSRASSTGSRFSTF